MAMFTFTGGLQYRTQQEGTDADAWLTNWRSQHVTEITSATQNLLTSGVQDDGQGCVCEVDFSISFDTGVADAQATYRQEIYAALFAGGTVADADCNSYLDF